MSAVFTALQTRYSGNEWAFLWEVPNGTASAKQRTADALAMNLWPSRGLELHGHEVKVSRADWLRELKSPEKAEPVFKFCDRWWLVVSDAEIVKDGELPPTWGLLVLRGKNLIQKVEAPRLTDRAPITKSFLASLLRCATEQAKKTTGMDAALGAKYQQGLADATRTNGFMLDQAQRQLKQLQDAVATFQKSSGISIDTYSAGDIGRIVHQIRTQGLQQPEQLLQRIESVAQQVVNQIKTQRELNGLMDQARQQLEKATP